MSCRVLCYILIEIITLRFYVEKRLRYILLKTYWEGEVSRGDLVKMFGIASTQATKDFQGLKLSYPNAVFYDGSTRRYVPDHALGQYVSTYSFDEYYSIALAPNNFAYIMQTQSRAINPEIYRVLNKSIRNSFGLKVSYRSMNDPTGLKLRTIYPHSVIRSGFRWHIRAYELQSKSFKDFNIARINPTLTLIPEKLNAAHIDNDKSWNTMVTLLLTPNLQFNEQQRKVIASDHNGSEESMVIQVNTRAALLLYTLHLYELTDFTESPPTSQHLQIGNLNNIWTYLPI
ncbi:hypothetical protein LCGC14_0700510 [marine sediment metagenome]|uniref:WYL domain-containing protein n=1 Tax=marine sediment metagenome TaxID=412755 RepID=A0A0F9QHX8_9ZZZZ